MCGTHRALYREALEGDHQHTLSPSTSTRSICHLRPLRIPPLNHLISTYTHTYIEIRTYYFAQKTGRSATAAIQYVNCPSTIIVVFIHLSIRQSAHPHRFVLAVIVPSITIHLTSACLSTSYVTPVTHSTFHLGSVRGTEKRLLARICSTDLGDALNKVERSAACRQINC